jgi:hypothetical protein
MGALGSLTAEINSHHLVFTASEAGIVRFYGCNGLWISQMPCSFVTLATCSSHRILKEFACTRLAVSERSVFCSVSEHPPWWP